ncbi:MAG: glutamine--tRNA ligase, partial [Pseudomonadota bacterium]
MSEADARPSNFIRQIIDKDLADGKHTSVHTRFPPEPNGYLHIGHAKSICLNFGIAQDYQGQCNLRFDDTNPEKEDIEYVESIKKDVNWLGFEWDGEVCYSSNYFDKLYEYAIELINKGLAYVDELSPEQIREYRGTLTAPGKPSPYRDRPIEENLALFEKMRAGEFEEGKACLRAKIDMGSSFMVMRDPVIYRVRFATHHQTGDKWCIYPMYDFTHCISDALEGITHSICTLEFMDNRRLYDWVLDNITIDCRPHQYEFSRLNLEYTVMSKRKLNQLVTEKLVDGWDDPRMPTVSGLRRRGFTSASIREFCKRIGVTKQENMIEFGSLESCIRDDLNEN